MGLMFGAITSSMLGATLVFILPVGIGVICKEDVPSFFVACCRELSLFRWAVSSTV